MAESRKDKHNKTNKLSNVAIYKIKQDQVGKLKTELLNYHFRKVNLDCDATNTEFKLKLYAVVRESEDKLVNLLKECIHTDEYNNTYTRDNYILIAFARSKQDAFAICSGKAYLHILPFADMDFAFNVAKAVLDPNKIMQIKYRFLNGRTITTNRHFHRSTPASNQVSYLNNIFFIVDEFQSTILPRNESDYRILKESTLKCSVKVKKSNVTFCKSLSLQNILDLMHDLLHLKQNVTEDFEFLDVAKPITDKNLISSLEKELINVLSDNKELLVNEEGFFLCPKNNDQWNKCEKVHLRNKNDKTITKFMPPLHFSDVIAALKNQSPEQFELNFKANKKWQKYDDLINYVHGSVVCDTKRYFHVGKNWYIVDEKHIETIKKSFNQLVKNLMTDADEKCLPLPWNNKDGNQHEGTIDQEHCIRFCKNVLKKTDVDPQALEKINLKECKSPPVALSTIIGQEEYKVYKQSLEKVDEGKYNEAYISLDKIWRKNTCQGPSPTFLVGDKILVKNVELFDIMRISDQYLYLYHVKEGFGQKTRDAVSQIHISASLLYKEVQFIETSYVLDAWYDSVRGYKGEDNARLNQRDHLIETINDKETFKKLFQSRKIVYVYAFLDDSNVDRFQDLTKPTGDKLNNTQAKESVKNPGNQTAFKTRSYIAMAELLWLAEDFKKYPNFGLLFCQIRKPLRSDDHSKSASDSSKLIKPPKIPANLKKRKQKRETLSEILTRLESNILEGETKIEVERNNILFGAFNKFGSKGFDPWKKLYVKFTAEDAIDDGGPGREFMRLALGAIKQLQIFTGPDNEKKIQYNEQCFAEEQYFKAGQMLAYFIVHRGPCPNFFHRTLYNELAKCEQVGETIADASNKEGFKAAVPNAEERSTLGKREQPTSRSAPKQNSALLKRKSIEQFKSGLQTMGILDEVKKNKKQWGNVFIYSTKVLTAIQLEQLFVVKWSERREIEETVFSYWQRFLKDIEDKNVLHAENNVSLTLEDLLVFATGADQVPLLGFPRSPHLSFRHPEDLTGENERHKIGFPIVSTCSMELKMPVLDDYETFRCNMRNAISLVDTFTTA